MQLRFTPANSSISPSKHNIAYRTHSQRFSLGYPQVFRFWRWRAPCSWESLRQTLGIAGSYGRRTFVAGLTHSCCAPLECSESCESSLCVLVVDGLGFLL